MNVETSVILLALALVAVLGAAVFAVMCMVWLMKIFRAINDVRSQHYQDFMERKRQGTRKTRGDLKV